MRTAKIQPFLDIYIAPDLLKFFDKYNKQNRFITAKELAFVACRITTSALNNSYSTHYVSYDTFLNKWRADYKKFTDQSPTRHKMVHITKVLAQHNIIKKVNRGSNTPVYSIATNNPYHPEYRPVKVKNPEISKKTVNQQTKSSKKETPEQLQAESDSLDREFDNILTKDKERKIL